MSKKLSILMLLMAFFVPWAANAQQTVTIGEGTSQQPTLPVHMVYSYSLSQQIYTADEIGMAGNITSIAFQYASSGSFTMEDIQVYMLQVDKSVFASNTDMVSLTDATKVYEGTFSANGAGWVTIQLNTPFPYDGDSNLLVCCFDPDSSKPGSSYKFYTTSTTGYTSIVYFDNSRIPDTTNVSTPTGSKAYYRYRNNIQLVIAPSECQKPATLEINGSTLSWTEGSGSYNVEYKKASETNWTRAYTNLAATTCTLTLDPNTDYEARVQSACSGDETSGWKTVSFTTPCGIVTIDATHSWSEGFESYNDGTSTNSGAAVADIRCWERVQINSTTNSPFVYRNYEYAASTGLASLELKTSNSTAVMVALPEFSEAIENLNVAFNYNCTSTSLTYTAELGYISDVTDATTFVKLFDIPKPVARSTGHSSYSKDLYEAAAAANAPEGSRVAIKFGTTTSSTPSWNLDDFVVSYVSPCRKPIGLTVVPNSVTTHNATLTWDAEAGATFQWTIDGTWNETQNNTVELTGLTPEHTYTFTLRKKCSNTEFSNEVSVNFTTAIACPAPTNLTVNNITGHTATAHWNGSSNGYNVYLGSLGPNGNVLNTNFDNGIPGNWNNSSSHPWTVTNGYIKSSNAGVASSTSSISVTVTFPANGSVEFDAECMGEGTSTYYDHCDFIIDGATQFSYGANISGWNHYSFDVTAGQHTFTWSYTKDSSVNPTGDYFAIDNVVMIAASVVWGDPIYVENTEYTFNGLSPESRYFVKVESNCGNDGLSSAVGPVAFDTEIACMIPTNLAATNITGHSAMLNWQGTSQGYNLMYTPLITMGFYNFEAGEIPSNFTNGSTSWTIWETNPNSGDYCIASNNHNAGGTTATISLTATYSEAGTIEFYSRVSSESATYDYGRFLIDNTEKLKEGGTSPNAWTKRSYEVAAGTHTFTWEYRKDSSVDGGEDRYYIDDIVMSAASSAWVTVNTSDPTYTLTGLTSETIYQVKVQSDCDDEGTSGWTNILSFITDVSCSAPNQLAATNITSNSALLTWGGDAESYNVSYISTVFSEGFEDYSSQEVPTGWTVYKNGTPNSVAWSVYNPSQYLSGVTAHSGNNVTIAFSRPNNQADNWLITPQLDLQGTLKFWVRRGTGDSRLDKYEVRLSTTGIDTVDFNVTLKPLETASDEWEEVVIDLSEYEGQQGYIAIHHYHFGGYYLMVDDFSLSGWVTVSTDTTSFEYQDLSPETEYQWRVQSQCGEEGESRWATSSFTTTETCPAPTDVTASYLAPNGTTLTWTGYNDSYNIKVGHTTNYDFEDNTISGDFVNSTSQPWTVTTSDKHSGSRSVKSASGFTSANSDLKLTVTLEYAGTISFWEKVSSEASVDQGSFLIDNRTQYTTSGISNDWTFHSFELTSGTHTLTWRYYKNGSGNDGNDCFYVDDIAFTPWTIYTTTESPFVLDDASHIQPVTTYTVIINGVCGDEVSEESEAISFTTSCVPVTNLPLTEDFNSYSADVVTSTTAPSSYPNHQLPNCWQFLNLSASTSTYPQAFLTSSSTYAVSSKCLLFKSSSQTPLYALLPEIEAATSTLQLTFTYRNGGTGTTNGTLHVGYMTDPTVDSTFVSLYTCAQTTTKTTETIYFVDAPDDSYMAFKYEGGNNGILGIDDIVVEEIPSCFPVGTLSYDDLASTTVNLSWTLVDTTQTAWQISVMSGNYERFANANTNENYHLRALTPATEYTIKVRANCAGNGYGAWSDPIVITTLESCPTPTALTYSNLTAASADLEWVGSLDVEEYTVRYRTTAGINTIFSEDFSNGIGSWTMEGCDEYTGVEYVVDGTGHKAFRFSYIESPNPPQDQYLISPEISGITSDAVLKFIYWTNSNQYEPEKFHVGLSSTDNDIDSFSWGDEITLDIMGNQTYYANVPAGTKYIAIKCTSYDGYYLYIDDIVVGFEVEAGEWHNTTATETNTQIIGLNGGTEYELQVRSNCLEDAWSEMITFTTLAEGTKVLVTEGDWNTGSNWMPAGAPTIEENAILRASATITGVAEANKITFEGTPTPTLTINDGGQLKTNNSVTATVKKNFVGYGEANIETNIGYYLIATPTSSDLNLSTIGFITSVADTTYDFYSWNRTATNEEWHNCKGSNSPSSIVNGVGYLYATMNDVEMSFTSALQPSNPPVIKTPEYNGISGGWNLYGNPFPCDAYLSTEAESMAFYRLVDTTFVAATGAIAPMEGFFAQATAAGQTFTISREAPAKCGQLNMSLNHNGSSIDNALIIFGEGQNLSKMSFRENSSKVYMPVNGKDCAAVFTNNAGEMPVSFVAKENGSFTLIFSNENVTFSYLHLIDTITGADIDLLQTPSYSFEARTTDNANRFKVAFTTIKH